MKTLLLMLVASLSAITSFAQKAKAFEVRPASSVIVAGGGNSSLSLKEQMKKEVTKTYSYSTSIVLNNVSRSCPSCKTQLVANRVGSKQAGKAYSCEMHPNIACAENGKCPMCKA